MGTAADKVPSIALSIMRQGSRINLQQQRAMCLPITREEVGIAFFVIDDNKAPETIKSKSGRSYILLYLCHSDGISEQMLGYTEQEPECNYHPAKITTWMAKSLAIICRENPTYQSNLIWCTGLLGPNVLTAKEGYETNRENRPFLGRP
ncbi:hypothetical protein MTR67_019680 [Solanum verrucosum]|uniref:Uncharacterized protein n=1 Tax=Solanum verrucosum TaxID=315347 RepID=A0AAF0QS98_SOLVR|nr:hypothetical protein MTR67_019680 [Solanum verrucosum]